MSAKLPEVVRVNPFIVNLRDRNGELRPTVAEGFHRYGDGRNGVLSPLGIKADKKVLLAARERVPLIQLDRAGYTAHGDSQRSLLLPANGLGRLANNDVAVAQQDNGLAVSMRRVGLVAVIGTADDLRAVSPIGDVLTLIDSGSDDEEIPPILVSAAKLDKDGKQRSPATYLSMFAVSLGCGIEVPARVYSSEIDDDLVRGKALWFTADPRPQTEILGSPQAILSTTRIGPIVPAIGANRRPLEELAGVA